MELHIGRRLHKRQVGVQPAGLVCFRVGLGLAGDRVVDLEEIESRMTFDKLREPISFASFDDCIAITRSCFAAHESRYQYA